MKKIRALLCFIILILVLLIFYRFSISTDEVKLVIGAASFFALTITSLLLLIIRFEESLLKLIKMQILDFDNWVKNKFNKDIFQDQTEIVNHFLNIPHQDITINNTIVYHVNDHIGLKHILFNKKDLDSLIISMSNSLEIVEQNLAVAITDNKAKSNIHFFSEKSKAINDTIKSIELKLLPTYKEQKINVIKWRNISKRFFAMLNQVNAPTVKIKNQYFWGITSANILGDSNLKKIFEKLKI